MGLDRDWVALASLDAKERVEQMRERFRALFSLSDEERRARLAAMIHAEYELPDTELHEFTLSRLRAWIELAAEDREATRALGQGYDDVFDRLPASIAMRRATILQTVAGRELTISDIDTLFDVIPGLTRQLPQKQHAIRSAEAEPVRRKERGKPFWARLWFGRDTSAAAE